MSSDQCQPWITSRPSPAIAAPPQSDDVLVLWFLTAATPNPPLMNNRFVKKICSAARLAVCEIPDGLLLLFTHEPSRSHNSSSPGRRPQPSRAVYAIALSVVERPRESLKLSPPKPKPRPNVNGRSVTCR